MGALTKSEMAERLYEELGLNNPKTGEEIPISARRVVTFRPGQKLKARVEAYGDAMAAREQVHGAEGDETTAGSSRAAGADIAFGMRALDGGTE